MQLTRFTKRGITLIKVYLFSIFLFFLARLIYFFRFSGWLLWEDNSSKIVEAFILGVRFDTMVICYFLALVFLLALIQVFIHNIKLNRIIDIFSKYWCLCFICIFSFVLMVDQQYYTYFQIHLNIIAFGLVDDSTSVILESVWTDHPVIKITLIFLGIIYLTYFALTVFFSRKNTHISIPKKYNLIFLLSFIYLFVLGARGKIFSEFPLLQDDSVISKNNFINDLSLNGIFTFYNSIERYQEFSDVAKKNEVFKKYGFSSIEDALSVYYQKHKSNFTGNNKINYLFKKTKKNTFLKNNPPNVVFILMESFGAYYLNFHSPQLNLLGAFEKHLITDFHFKNFLSSTRGTIYSLETLIMGRSYLVNTSLRQTSFEASVAFPFSKNNYKSYFISGGKIKWRDLDKFLPYQYFDEAYGKGVIQNNIPHISENSWGVNDEHLFEEIYNVLIEKNRNPKFIFAMTTTNHTPYMIPENYSPKNIQIHDTIKSKLLVNKTLAKQNFLAYQYANHHLGLLIDKIKNSPLKNNTIVAVTGDHNSYTLFPYDTNDIAPFYKHAVPFYLYIPEKYKPPTAKRHTNRFGSHKDIFPTLINLALSDQMYFNSGDNLLDNTRTDSYFYGKNEQLLITPLKQKNINGKPNKKLIYQIERARRCLIDWYYAE